MAWHSISTYSDGGTPSQTDLNNFVDNINFLSADLMRFLVYADNSGDFTTTSTTFTAVGSPFTTGSQTFQGGLVLVIFRGSVFASSGSSRVYLQVTVDGTAIAPMTNGQPTSISGQDRGGVIVRWFTVSAGSHTIALSWKVDSGTGKIVNSGGNVPFFYVKEISWTP